MGTGLAGLTTLLTKPVTYIMTTPETRPATVPPSVLSQPASLPDRFSPMGRVLLDRVQQTSQDLETSEVWAAQDTKSATGRARRSVSRESALPGSPSSRRR